LKEHVLTAKFKLKDMRERLSAADHVLQAITTDIVSLLENMVLPLKILSARLREQEQKDGPLI
jgi:hypothetical protein